jgi:hypothetical protein
MHMRDCLADLDIFGCILQGASWFGWRVLLIAAAGEELTDDERAEFKRLTGRDREPGRFCRELIVAAGRRAGKTQALICFAVWIAVFCDYRGVLAPGETGISEGDLIGHAQIVGEPRRSWWLRLFDDENTLAREYAKTHARVAQDE